MKYFAGGVCLFVLLWGSALSQDSVYITATSNVTDTSLDYIYFNVGDTDTFYVMFYHSLDASAFEVNLGIKNPGDTSYAIVSLYVNQPTGWDTSSFDTTYSESLRWRLYSSTNFPNYVTSAGTYYVGYFVLTLLDSLPPPVRESTCFVIDTFPNPQTVYELAFRGADGTTWYTDTLYTGPTTCGPTGIAERETKFVLPKIVVKQSGGGVEIRYNLEEPSFVRLSLYNSVGQRVKVLEKGFLKRGSHRAYWDRRDEAGRKVSNGVYIISLETERSILRKKVILR